MLSTIIIFIVAVIVIGLLVAFGWVYESTKDKAWLDRTNELNRELMDADQWALHWHCQFLRTEWLVAEQEQEIADLRRAIKLLTRRKSRPNGH